MRSVLLAPSFIFAAACFSPTVEEGAECTPEGDCPPGQTCADDGRCYVEAPSFHFARTIDIHPRSLTDVVRDFPLAIALAGDDGLIAHARDDGSDIHFTEADGTTELAFEIESFDRAQGDLVAWVNVPVLSLEDSIVMQYGADPVEHPPASATWSERYLAVWHGQSVEDPALLADSTGNGNDGHSEAARTPTRVAGQIGPALSFDGVDDQVEIAEAVPLVVLDRRADLLVTMWVRVSDMGGNDDLATAIGKGTQSGTTAGFGFQMGKDSWTVRLRGSFTGGDTMAAVFGDAAALSGRWVLLAAAITHQEVGQEYFQVAASVDATDAATGYWLCQTGPCGLDLGGPLYLGHPDAPFEGLVDEVRIVDRTAGPEDLGAEHENLSDPESFYTVGPEETLPR
jgi:hypothetical protein